MTNTVGLIALANGMRVYLKSQGVSATVTAVGWNQRPQQINQGPGQANRIVLYPGFEPGGNSGAGGELTRDHRPSRGGQETRGLLTWMKAVTMSVWACDVSDRHNEELQITAVENLLERAIQAVHNSIDPNTNTPVGVGNIEWGSVRYTNPPAEMRFGQEILVEFVQKCTIFDKDISYCSPQPSVTRDPNSPS